MEIGSGRLLLGDCLEQMATLPNASVDMILCDLPYGTTACSWDSIIPFEPLWGQYWRIAKPNAAIVLTASQPFTTALAASDMRRFKYCWYWVKTQTTGFMNANKMPLKNVEEACVFYRGQPTYNPQGVVEINKTQTRKRDKDSTIYNNMGLKNGEYEQKLTNYPRQILEFPRDPDKMHPTQKPVALFEYLIRTYTQPGETVLDNCMGSGTTAIAAERSGRRWIGIERDEGYYNAALARIYEAVTQPAQP